MLDINEKEIFKGTANMQYQRGAASLLGHNKGGHLILTNQRLIFLAHAMNIGQKEYYIPLSEIVEAENGFHVLTPTPNMIKVECKNGDIYKFVVKGREKDTWKKLIVEQAMKANREHAVSLAPTTRRFCTNCGSKLSSDANFCGKCGSKL